ncbi:MAG: NFACT family protein, partial [Chloroflexia bacterium]|nr:NFACT family protein [Chloroflexia bacterium]
MPDPYDVFTVAAITAELQATITNGRVQRIGLLDPRTIGAEIYAGGRRHYLIASADDRSPRLRLAPALPSLDSALVTPFGLLLRKYVRGGLIQSIDQPPLERLVRFSIAKRLDPLKTSCLATRDDAQVDEIEALAEVEVDHDNHQNLRQLTLFVELMGRHSNLILVDDDGRIMESAKRVTASMSRVRQVLPRLPYLPPPPPERLDPRQISAARASRFLAGVAPEGDFARALVSGFRGISPLLAREITFRVSGPSDAHGNVTVPSGEALAATMRELFESLATSDWRPHIYRQRGDEEPGQVVAFAPVPMAHLAAEFVEEPMTSVSAALAVAEEALGRTSDGPG